MDLTKVSSLSGGYIPQDTYILRCIKQGFKQNSNGNPMITLTFEMCTESYTNKNGETVTIAGMKFFHNMTLTAEAAPYIKDFHTKCGLPMEIDETNPDLEPYKGLVVYATCYSREEKKFQPVTEEQKAAGQKQGDPIRDASGQQLVNYQPVIRSFEGRVGDEVIAGLPTF